MITLKRLRVEDFKLLRHVEVVFPRQGSVLIEGLNESGKSTLFESIFFALYGAPLATEGRGRGNLDSAIRYGADSTSAELLLEVGDTELEIRRSLKRGRPTQASLAIRRPGAPEERVAGVLAVNARVVEELGGLDGDALLNSCFVEQKKLSKLEDLATGQRKDSLRKLLNLEKLTALGERFRVSTQDERALAEARARLELAEVASRLPKAAAERGDLEACLRESGATTLSPWERAGVRAPVREGEGPPEPRPREGEGPPEPPGIREDAARREPRPPGSAPSPQPSPKGRGSPPTDRAPSGGGSGSPDPLTAWDWSPSAARLAALRDSVLIARRRAALLASAGVAGLILAAGLVATGTTVGAWLLPMAAALLLLAAVALNSTRAPKAEGSGLEADLSGVRDSLVARMGDLEGRQRRLQERLGIDGANLDPEDCRLQVADLVRQMEVRRRAAALVEGTMERIVRLVLPSTERNLGQILPLLTAGRYHEARIAEDYQVQVWDDSAGRYVSKSVFSGGARDQFSLALRLAFAVATLPQELGAAPGFIFLDEPLSSFDGPRTEALVQLLTAGQVAANFGQIFVISHNRSFDVGAFQYRLVMRDGRVVESNLPTR